MSSSFDQIPDSISFGELEKLAADAPKEPKKEGPYAGYDREGLCDLVNDKLQELQDACPHPIAHKLAMLQVIDNMLDWHIQAAEAQAEAGDIDSAGCWMRDAGKWQAIHNIVATISVGKDDFTVSDK